MKIIKGIIKTVFLLILVAFAAAAAGLGYLSVTEYRPAAAEELGVEKGAGDKKPEKEEIKILSFNIGYGGLGDRASFIMDGGEGNGKPATREDFEAYWRGALKFIKNSGCDALMLQEIDRGSNRSYNADEVKELKEALNPQSSVFASNYLCSFVPFPWPPIGRVDSGLLTAADFGIKSAERVSLPNPFSWPYRIANLKRAALVTHIPVEGSDRELCLINLHLEAYTAEEGRRKQQDAILKIMREEYEKGNWVIAGGDFNQSFPATRDTFPIIDESWIPGELDEKELPEGFSYAFDRKTPSCRLLNGPYDKKTAQHYIIDGFIVSGNVEVVSVKTHDLGFEFSDHNPVEIAVKLK